MFKEIIILMLSLQCSVAKTKKSPPCKENATEFIAHKNILQNTRTRICILSDYLYEEITENPAKYLESPSQTKINIEMSKFQIITIKEESVTMSMYFEVEWVDQRLQPLNLYHANSESVLNSWAFVLKEEEYEKIWMPSIGYGTELISKDRKVDHVFARINNRNYTSGARMEKGIDVTAEVVCQMDFQNYPFDHHLCSIEFEDLKNETIIESISLKTAKQMSRKKNDYNIQNFEEYSLKNPARFGVKISFERDSKETNGVLINYNLMSAIIVLVSSVNFLIDPKDSNRAAILIALILVLATVFQAAQAEVKGFNLLTKYIFVCLLFMAMAVLYYGLIIFKLRRFNKIGKEKLNSKERDDSKTTNTILKSDRWMLVIYCIAFAVYNSVYFIVNCLM